MSQYIISNEDLRQIKVEAIQDYLDQKVRYAALRFRAYEVGKKFQALANALKKGESAPLDVLGEDVVTLFQDLEHTSGEIYRLREVIRGMGHGNLVKEEETWFSS
jgi:hypothetical protein